jgi:hypothetical protein
MKPVLKMITADQAAAAEEVETSEAAVEVAAAAAAEEEAGNLKIIKSLIYQRERL